MRRSEHEAGELWQLDPETKEEGRKNSCPGQGKKGKQTRNKTTENQVQD